MNAEMKKTPTCVGMTTTENLQTLRVRSIAKRKDAIDTEYAKGKKAI